MKCVHCGQEITENNKFCPFCGKEQVLKCSSCGKEATPGTAFCVHCGARIGDVTPGASQPISPPTIQQTPGNTQAAGDPSLNYQQPLGGALYYTAQPAGGQGISMQSGSFNIQPDMFVGVGRRFLALLIDTIILYAINYFIAGAFGGTATTDMTGGMSTDFNLQGPAALLVMIIDLAYFVVMEGMMGATIGKLIFGIRVRMADGSKVSMGASLIRNLLRIVDGIPYLIPYLLGAILVWTSPTKQRLGDRAAKTIVVRASALK